MCRWTNFFFLLFFFFVVVKKYCCFVVVLSLFVIAAYEAFTVHTNCRTNCFYVLLVQPHVECLNSDVMFY